MIISRVIGPATTLLFPVSSPAACSDLSHCRGIPSIVFSCASTIFLCTWVAWHPDVPTEPREARWKRLLKRVALMVVAFLAPEAVFIWAIFQWKCACDDLKRLLKKHPSCGWTETHAMFASMGGFQLVKEDGSRHDKYFVDEVLGGEYEMPKIDEDEIQDKSKSDYIAKIIAVIQTSWFGIQVAHRVIKGLEVTRLELTTLGHVAVNIFIYWCWWNKPSDVRFPIVVHAKKYESRQGAPLGGHGEHVAGREPEAQVPAKRSLPFRVRMATANLGNPILIILLPTVIFLIFCMFGVIHCLAWNSSFPTHIERTLWRASAAMVTAVYPIAPLALSSAVLAGMTEGRWKVLWSSLTFLFLSSYSLARICLLVIALTSLRALPYGAYETPSWASYMPHLH